MANTLKTFALVATSATILSFTVNSAPTHAAVLFDNGAPNLQAVVPSDQSSPDFLTEAGGDFSFNNAANITRITWSGIYLFGSIPSTDNFSVRLSHIASGAPAINPFATLSGNLNRVDSGLNVDPDGKLYNYALTLTTPFSIGAGNYLLSIVNNTTADPNDDWAWAINDFSGGNVYFRANPGDTWGNFPTKLSFAIEGNTTSIPTPALLPGLIGLSLSVWRKRKAEA